MDALIYNPLWFYLIAVNLYLFCLMGYDKYQAVKQGWRVPELSSSFRSRYDWRRIRRFDRATRVSP